MLTNGNRNILKNNLSQCYFIHKISFLRFRASTSWIVRPNLWDWHHWYARNFSLTDNNVYGIRNCLYDWPPHQIKIH